MRVRVKEREVRERDKRRERGYGFSPLNFFVGCLKEMERERDPTKPRVLNESKVVGGFSTPPKRPQSAHAPLFVIAVRSLFKPGCVHQYAERA